MGLLVIDPDDYEHNELGAVLYRAMSIGIEGAEPYTLIDAEERAFYDAAARDFIRYLQRNEGKRKEKSRARLWTFDFGENRPRRLWMTCENRKNPDEWTVGTGKDKYLYVYGESAFLSREDALRYGRDSLREHGAELRRQVERLNTQIQDAYTATEQEDIDGDTESDSRVDD